MSWFGALKTLVDLFSSDSPGAQPYGAISPVVTGAATLGVAATQGLPNRPTTAASPSAFIFAPSGNLAAATTYIAQVPASISPVPANAYYPGDQVTLQFTKTQLATFNVFIQNVGATTIYEILYAVFTTVASYVGVNVTIQLNPTGTAWVLVNVSYY